MFFLKQKGNSSPVQGIFLLVAGYAERAVPCFFALCLLVFFFSPVCAQEPDSVREKKRILQLLQGRMQPLQAFTCEFSQEKYFAIVDEVLLSRGHLTFSGPDRLRLEYTEPFPVVIGLAGSEGRLWDASSGSMEDFTLHNLNSLPMHLLLAHQILLWADFDIFRLEQQYALSLTQQTPPLFELLPRHTAIQQHMTYSAVGFAKDSPFVNFMEMHEVTGDWTRLYFTAPQAGKELPASLFIRAPARKKNFQ